MLKHRMLFAAAAALALCSCNSGTKESTSARVHNVFAINPEPVGNAGTVTLPATVEEARTISVGFKTAGQIERIYVKEGDRISAGQTIAMLDTVDYALGISSLREKYSQMLTETDRQAKLHASGNMSDNDFDKAASGLRQVGLQLQLEENKLAYCRLSSPTSGIVTKVNFEASEMVDAGTPVIELMDNSRLEAIVDLPVRLYAARADFSGFYGETSLRPGVRFPMEMLSLTPRADNSQLYRLRLSVPADAGVTPGMNITVSILSTGDDAGSVTVPLSSVFENEGHSYVWVINPADSVVTATEVTLTGTGENGRVEITSGLSAAELIVRAGVHHLVNGEKVNLLPGESETNPGNVL